MRVTPYVLIPLTIFDARKSRSISAQQMNILICAYLWASRPGFRVAAYSAQRVCEFQGLEINRANLERYRRAAVDLLARNLIRRDYRKIDPRRGDQKERTYSIWIPAPDRFVAVGSPEENQTRLWSGSVFINTHCESGPTRNATPITDASGSQSAVYSSEEARNASLGRDTLRIPNQQIQEKETLPSSQGEASPLPSPPGMRSNGAGLLENRKPLPSVAASKKNQGPLNPAQGESLENAAILYADFSVWLYDFSPDTEHIEKLLRYFDPLELLYAQINRFPPGEKFNYSTMAHFFRKAAQDSIRAARIKGTATSEPAHLKKISCPPYLPGERDKLVHRFQPVVDAWREVFPAE
jgi:hypothetical protein